MTRTADLITAAVLLLIGAIVVSDSLRLGAGWGTDGPKSGFFPFWMAAFLVVCCGVITLQAWRRDYEARPVDVTTEALAVTRLCSPSAGNE